MKILTLFLIKVSQYLNMTTTVISEQIIDDINEGKKMPFLLYMIAIIVIYALMLLLTYSIRMRQRKSLMMFL